MPTPKQHRGWIYIASNSSMPGILKIGKSDADPSLDRLKALQSTGVPTPFDLEYCCLVWNPLEVEKDIHAAFASDRIEDNREHFTITIDRPVLYIREAHDVLYEDISEKALVSLGDPSAVAADNEIQRLNKVIPLLEELLVPYNFIFLHREVARLKNQLDKFAASVGEGSEIRRQQATEYLAESQKYYTDRERQLKATWAAYFEELRKVLGRDPGPSEQLGNLTVEDIQGWSAFENALKISERVQKGLELTKQKLADEHYLPPQFQLGVEHEPPELGVLGTLRERGFDVGLSRGEEQRRQERQREYDRRHKMVSPPDFYW